MASITQGDFKYYKDKLKKDKAKHEHEFIERINPDMIDRYFEGDPDDERQLHNGEQFVDRISLNNLFPTTATLVSQFYPQNPVFIPIPKRPQDEYKAKIASAALNYYYNQMGALEENQKAIISAWMYGIGVTKQGWCSYFSEPEPAKTTNNSKMGKLLKRFSRNPEMEKKESREYIIKEGPFLEYVNPKNIYLDSENPFGKWRVFHQYIPKSLYEVRTSNLYDISDDFVARFKKNKDEREVMLELYESWYWLKDGLYVLVSVDGWNQPLRWEKAPYAAEGFPFKVLSLTTQVNKLYPIPHMKVAQRLSRLNDYILTLQKKHIEKHKNITVFDGDAFEKDDKERIKRNEIGLNVFAKKPGVAAQHVGGNTIPKDMFGIQEIIQNNIKEILTVIGLRAGGMESEKTLGQDQIKEYGNQLRASAMQDKISEFLKSQGKKLLQDLKQFATAPVMFEITGLDLRDPQTGEMVTDSWVEFATDRHPEYLSEVLPKELDLDIDVSNSLSRNLPVQRKQALEFAQIAMQFAPLLAQQGKSFNAYRYLKKVAESFESFDNVEQFFDDLQQPMGMGVEPVPGSMPAPEAPTEPTQQNIVPGV